VCFGEGDDLVGTQLVERDGQAGMSDLGGVAEPLEGAVQRPPDLQTLLTVNVGPGQAASTDPFTGPFPVPPATAGSG